MTLATSTECPACGRERTGAEALCSLCGHLFARSVGSEPGFERPAAGPETSAAVPPGRLHRVARASRPEETRGRRRYLLAGALTAPVLASTPLLQYMGWFLSSLTHELGHTAVAWFFGAPAFPVIRLDGHAAAFHRETMPWLVGAVALLLAGGGWRLAAESAHRSAARIVVGALLALYLVVAFTPLHEPLFLLAGHGSELLFGTVFLWRCATGVSTASPADRLLSGTLGAYLLGSNALLSARLVLGEAARLEYASSGSFGLTNDYLRVGLPLPLVAGAMGLASLALAGLVLHVTRPIRPA